MPSREEIARRHGLPDHLADSLHGATPAEWEADAAGRAQLMGMFAPRELDAEPAEPPVEGRAPADKDVHDYTPEESAALHESFDRTVREAAKRDEREAQQWAADERRSAELGFNDSLTDALRPGAKAERGAALVRLLHPPTSEER